MTKRVRIENADNSNHVLVVQTWAKGVNEGPDALVDEPHTLVSEVLLSNPTDLCEAHVWAGQYLVVKEVAV